MPGFYVVGTGNLVRKRRTVSSARGGSDHEVIQDLTMISKRQRPTGANIEVEHCVVVVRLLGDPGRRFVG
jgi:hypothetical protein